MCQKWFAKFPGEEFSLKDVPCSVIPVGIDNNHIKILPDNNQHYITSEITYSKYLNQALTNHLHVSRFHV